MKNAIKSPSSSNKENPKTLSFFQGVKESRILRAMLTLLKTTIAGLCILVILILRNKYGNNTSQLFIGLNNASELVHSAPIEECDGTVFEEQIKRIAENYGQDDFESIKERAENYQKEENSDSISQSISRQIAYMIDEGIDEQRVVDIIKLSLQKEYSGLQEDNFVFDKNNPADLDKLEKLHNQYRNLIIDERLSVETQYAILQTYKQYPELHQNKLYIEAIDGFKMLAKKQHTMRSQIKPSSLIKELILLQSPQNREYTIKVNILEKEGVITTENMSKEAKGGVLSHEMFHSLHYSTMLASDYILYGLGNAFASDKAVGLEKMIDAGSIAHGTSYGLIESREELYKGLDGDYERYHKENYLEPEEILYIVALLCAANNGEFSDEEIAEIIL